VIRYQITNGRAAAGADEWLRTLDPGVDFIQIREPDLSARDLARLVRLAMERTHRPRILVNDRADVAIACGAAGVHLRSGSVAPDTIRRIAPAGFVISVACHNAEDIRRAAGADYAILAPVFRPLSKEQSRPLLGLDAFRALATDSSIPVLALGGITEENTTACMDAGAAGIAGISLFARPPK